MALKIQSTTDCSTTSRSSQYVQVIEDAIICTPTKKKERRVTYSEIQMEMEADNVLEESSLMRKLREEANTTIDANGDTYDSNELVDMWDEFEVPLNFDINRGVMDDSEELAVSDQDIGTNRNDQSTTRQRVSLCRISVTRYSVELTYRH